VRGGGNSGLHPEKKETVAEGRSEKRKRRDGGKEEKAETVMNEKSGARALTRLSCTRAKYGEKGERRKPHRTTKGQRKEGKRPKVGKKYKREGVFSRALNNNTRRAETPLKKATLP